MRRFMFALGGWLAFMVVYLTILFVFGSPWALMVLAVYLGFVFGDAVGYKHGLKEGGDIVCRIWGLDTSEGRQRFIRERIHEKSRWN